MRALQLIAALSCIASSSCGGERDQAVAAAPSALIGERAYPLDTLTRETGKGQAPCVPRGLVKYAGDVLPYDQAVQVHPAFRARLREFERIVVQTGRDIYGRAPSRLLQMGAYRCRPNEKPRRLLSEHGLGNALDVSGVAFSAAGPRDALPRKVPKSMRAAFEVRVEDHWKASGPERLHREFLHELSRRVIAQADLFRVVLGPAYPDHENHLHLDCAPYRLVKVF